MAPTPAEGQQPLAVLPPPPVQDPAIARMAQKIQAQDQELERLKRTVMAPPQAPGGGMSKADLEKEFFKSPLEFTANIAQRAVQEYAQRQGPGVGFDTQVEMAARIARGDDPEEQAIFDKWRTEIEATVMQVDVPQRANATVWVNAFKMVKGNHARELMDSVRGKGEENRAPGVIIRPGNGPAAPTKAAPAPAGNAALSDEEKREARKFRISDERYATAKKENLEQSDFMRNPLGPSSWDQHVTFSTRGNRRIAREAKKAAVKK